MSNYERMCEILVNMKEHLESEWLNVVINERNELAIETINSYMTIVDLLSKYTHHFDFERED